MVHKCLPGSNGSQSQVSDLGAPGRGASKTPLKDSHLTNIRILRPQKKSRHLARWSYCDLHSGQQWLLVRVGVMIGLMLHSCLLKRGHSFLNK